MGFDSVPLSPLNSVMSANANGGTLLIQGEPHDVLLFGVGVRLGLVFREAVSSPGPDSGFSGLSLARQCGDDVFPDVGDRVSDSTR